MTPNQIEIFFSYSKADVKLRDELAKHLRGLERKGVITAWHESEISAGKERTEEIENHLNSASIILLLVSPDFIASDELWLREVTRAMERHEQQEARVIPVLLRDYYAWEDMPFGKLQPLPKNGKAITSESWQNQDAAFKDVVQGIQQAVKEISRQKILDDPTKSFITKLFWLIPWSSLFKIFITSGGVTLVVLIVRLFSGIFEPSELWVYDQMMRLQPQENPDDRLLIVEVTPQDIKTYSRPLQNQKDSDKNTPKFGASLPDEIIHQLLNNLLNKEAEVIGLDIYRDFAAYDKNLVKLFKDPRLIFICKIPDVGSHNEGYEPPPPEEVREEQVGFSDFLFDDYGVIRRQILQMQAKKDQHSKCGTSNDKMMDSFALKIAQKYLEATKNKQFAAKEEDGILTFNGIPLKQLNIAEQGGYRLRWDNDNFNGYQILLRYRNVQNPNDLSFAVPTKSSTLNIAKKVSVKEILENKIKKESVKNKIVLIGVPVESYDNISPTPFSSGGSEPQMWGLYIQAQQVSQIISAALDNPPRRLLTVWSLEGEMLWIISWAAIGAILVKLYKEPKKLIIASGGCIFLLYIFCLGLFILPTKIWIPFTPTAIAFLGTGGIMVLIEYKSQKTQKQSESS